MAVGILALVPSAIHEHGIVVSVGAFAVAGLIGVCVLVPNLLARFGRFLPTDDPANDKN